MSDLLEESMDHYALEPGAWWVPAHRGGSAPTPERAIELDERKTA